MASKNYSVKVPGSLMILGEHAVLHGGLAIVAAVNKYITVTLTPRSDRKILIKSTLGDYQTSLGDFIIKAPWQFVLNSIKFRLKDIKTGFTLRIESEFSDKIGFGSSAAVVVATLKVLYNWLNADSIQSKQLLISARKIINGIQKVGSGADAAASIYGGVIAYRLQPLKVQKLIDRLPLVAVYSGEKKPTVEVIKIVSEKTKKHPKIFAEIFKAINKCSAEAVDEIKNKNWKRLGELMNIHQGLQDAMGVNNDVLSSIVYELRRQSGIYGSKISGAGLGDCVIGLGSLSFRQEAGVCIKKLNNK